MEVDANDLILCHKMYVYSCHLISKPVVLFEQLLSCCNGHWTLDLYIT